MSNTNNNVAALFGNIFGRKVEDKEPTAEERANNLLKSYNLDDSVNQPLVEKLTTFELANDEAKVESEAKIKSVEESVEKAEKEAQDAKNVVNAAKAVGLRMRTLAVEVKASKERAQVAVDEAKAKIEALDAVTQQNKELGSQLVAGLTNQLLDVDMLANATEEEIKNLFGQAVV
jgi:hypothetical protein